MLFRSYNGANAGPNDTATFSVDFAVSPANSGAYQYYIVATDNAGNIFTAPTLPATNTVTITSDTTAPTGDFTTPTTPAANSFVSSATQTISAAITETNLATLTLTDNGTSVTITPSAVGGVTTFSQSRTFTEGAHTLVLTATDTAGNSLTRTRAFTVDTVAPVVAFSAPANNSVVQATAAAPVTVTGTVTDTGDTDPANTLTYTLKEGANTLATGPGAAFSYPYSAATEATHTLTLTATDKAGNVSSAVTLTLIVDRTAPVVAFTTPSTPAEGSYLNVASQTITATITETNLASWTLTDNGAQIGTGTTTTVSVVHTFPDGLHSLILTATDKAGNTASVTRTFVIDTVAPTAAQPTINGSTTPGSVTGTVTLTSTIADANALASDYVDYQVVFTGPVTKTTTLRTVAPLPQNITEQIDTAALGLTDGTYSVVVQVKDRAGNGFASSAATSLTISNTAVQLAWVAPPTPNDGDFLNGVKSPRAGVAPNPVFTANVSLPSVTTDSTVTYEFLDNGVSLGAPATLTIPAGTTQTASVTYNISGLPANADGPHTITLRVTNQASVVTQLTRTITVDRIAPVVAFSAPANNSVVQATAAAPVTVTGTVTDTGDTDPANTLTYTLKEGANTLATGPGAAFSYPYSAATEATHTLTLTATDKAGNVSSAVTLTLIVDRTAPVVAFTTPSTPAEGSYLNVAAQTITATITETNLASWTLTDNGAQIGTGATTTVSVVHTFPDGLHSLILTATDKAGNTASVTRTFVIDTVAPTATQPTINGSLTPPIVKGSILVASLITDPGNALATNAVTYRIDFIAKSAGATSQSVTPRTAAPLPYTTSDQINTSALGLTDGSYDVQIHVIDRAGNTNDSAATRITIANQLATITFVYPTPGVPDELGNKTLTLIGIATPNPTFTAKIGLAGVSGDASVTYQFLDNGSPVPGATGTVTIPAGGTGVASFSYPATTDGAHAITLQVTYADQLQPPSSPINIVVDRTRPNGSFTFPNPNDFVKGSVTVHFTLFDPSQNAATQPNPFAENTLRYHLAVSGAASLASPADGTVSGSSPPELTAALNTTNDAVKLTLTVTDKAGNQNAGPITLTFTADNIAPTAVFIDPTPGEGSYQPLASQTIKATITETNLASWTLTDDKDGQIGAGTANAVSVTHPFSEGAHKLTLIATDKAGNSNTTSPTVRNFVVDSIPPTATIDSVTPNVNGFVRGTVKLTGTVTDKLTLSGIKVDYQLLEGATVLGQGTVTPGFNPGNVIVNLNTVNLKQTKGSSDGLHTLTLKATNNAGNSANPPGTITIKVDNTYPTVTFTAPVNRYVRGSAVNVAFNLNDANPTVGDTLSYTITAVDANKKSLPFKIVGSTTGPPPISGNVTLDVSKATGAVTVTVTVTDTAGNSTPTDLNLTAENGKPIVKFTSPASRAYVGLSPITATITDNIPTAWTLTDTDSKGATVTVATGNTSGDPKGSQVSAAYNTAGKVNGTHSLTLIAIDATDPSGKSGNQGEVTLPIVVDTVRPTASFTAPTEGSETDRDVVFSATVSDNVTDTDNYVNYTFTKPDGTVFGSGQVNAGQFGQTDKASATLPIAGLNGITIVTLTVTDKAGNTQRFTRSVNINRVKPTANLTYTGAYYDEFGRLKLPVTNYDGRYLYVHGLPFTLVANAQNSPVKITLDNNFKYKANVPKTVTKTLVGPFPMSLTAVDSQQDPVAQGLVASYFGANQFTLTATNLAGVSALANLNILADGDGPVINLVAPIAPADSDFLAQPGSVVTMIFKVTSPEKTGISPTGATDASPIQRYLFQTVSGKTYAVAEPNQLPLTAFNASSPPFLNAPMVKMTVQDVNTGQNVGYAYSLYNALTYPTLSTPGAADAPNGAATASGNEQVGYTVTWQIRISPQLFIIGHRYQIILNDARDVVGNRSPLTPIQVQTPSGSYNVGKFKVGSN